MLPKDLEPYARKKVRNIAGDSDLFQALAGIRYPGKHSWSGSEWLAFLGELDACDESVEKWAASLQEIDPCS